MKIKNWSRFQHYKSGKNSKRPEWIKLYRNLLDDIEWHELDALDAKVLVMLWMLASENGGALPPIKTIAFRLRLPERQITSILQRLPHWVEDCPSDVLGHAYAPSRLEEEKEEERELEKEEEIAAPPPADDLEIPSHLDRRFAWQGKVIRLSKKDLDQWKASYPRLDLLGELLARDQYLADQPPDVQARWFQSTSQHLANRNMKAKAGEVVATAPPPIQKNRTELAYDKVAAKIEAMENGTDFTEKSAGRGKLLIGQRVLSDAEPGGAA